MSPASQGNLEVERYIGSCLISARSNSNNNNSSKSSPAQGNSNGNHLHQHHHANYMNKKLDGGGGGNGGGNSNALRGPSGRLQSRALLGCPHHGYAPPGSLVQPMCDCAARYGSPGHSPPGAGWTGVPLISMATNGRRNRKPTPSAPNGHRNQNRASPASPCAPGDGDPNMRSPLSRLAIHTQGAPLILSGHYNGRKNNNNNNVVQRGPGRQFKGELPGRRCVEVPREIRGGGGGGGGGSNNTPNSDCLSVASDESSGHSENSLPRIIKPRKRRKKDRKPAGGAASDGNNAVETDAGGELTGIVTLKPYVPPCHELYDVHRGGGRRREEDVAARRVAEHRVQRPDANPKSQHRPVEDTRDVKKVQSNHVEHVDADNTGQNTLFPFPCQPSTCQCRYCDPAGLIWDVDQHWYSPFLTPSSIDLSYPLFLTPPPEAKSFDFFNKDFKDSSSTVADSEAKELVRRSWSEPSASASCSDNEETRRALNDFGVIGGGRSCDIGARARKDSPRHTSTSSESSTHSTLSQNLEVSTEIVTSSLNGHRDLEIKFFSSTPPSVLVDVVGEYSGCENVDWGSSDKGQQELWIGSHQVSSVFSDDPGHRGSLGSSVWGNSVVGDGEGTEDRGYGDQLWPETWQDVVESTLDSNSKILSEEVNQLCLQNAEE